MKKLLLFILSTVILGLSSSCSDKDDLVEAIPIIYDVNLWGFSTSTPWTSVSGHIEFDPALQQNILLADTIGGHPVSTLNDTATYAFRLCEFQGQIPFQDKAYAGAIFYGVTLAPLAVSKNDENNYVDVQVDMSQPFRIEYSKSSINDCLTEQVSSFPKPNTLIRSLSDAL